MISLSFLNLPGDNPQWFGFSSPQLFWPEGQRWWPRAAGSSHAGCAAGRLNPANVPWKNCLPGLLVIIFFCARMVLHCSILFHFSQPWVTLDTIWRVAWVWTEDSHRCWGAFVDYKHISPNPFPMLSIPKLATFHDTWWYLTRIWHFFRGPRQTHARRNTWRRKSPPRCHGESPSTGDPRYRLLLLLLNNYWAKKPYITIQS